MASGTFYPSAATDDSQWFEGSGLENTFLGFGYYGGFSLHSFIRCTNVTIPAGATISSAFIRFRSLGSLSGTIVNVRIYCNNVDSSVIPTTVSEADALALTSVYSDWNNIAAWMTGSQYDTPDFSSAIQQVIDRVGWSSGNPLMVVIKNNGSSTSGNIFRQPMSYGAGTGSIPELHVEWTTQETTGSVSLPSPTMTGVSGSIGVTSSSIPTILAASGAHGDGSFLVPTAEAFGTAYGSVLFSMSEVDGSSGAHGAAIFPFPTIEATSKTSGKASLTLSILTIDAVSKTTGKADLRFPFFQVEGLTTPGGAMVVPKVIMSGKGSSVGINEFPFLEVDGEYLAGGIFQGNALIRKLSMTGKTGSVSGLQPKVLTVSASSKTSGKGPVTVPALTMNGVCLAGTIAEGDALFLIPQASGVCLAGVIVEADLIIPRISAAGNHRQGEVFSANLELPPLMVVGVSHTTGEASISFSILQALGKSGRYGGRYSGYVLQFPPETTNSSNGLPQIKTSTSTILRHTR